MGKNGSAARARRQAAAAKVGRLDETPPEPGKQFKGCQWIWICRFAGRAGPGKGKNGGHRSHGSALRGNSGHGEPARLFDSESFRGENFERRVEQLITDPDKPLLNKAISSPARARFHFKSSCP